MKFTLITDHEVDLPGEDESVIDINTWLEDQKLHTLRQVYSILEDIRSCAEGDYLSRITYLMETIKKEAGL